jgi:hypothetical protein
VGPCRRASVPGGGGCGPPVPLGRPRGFNGGHLRVGAVVPRPFRGFSSMHSSTIQPIRRGRAALRIPHMRDTPRPTAIASNGASCTIREPPRAPATRPTPLQVQAVGPNPPATRTDAETTATTVLRRPRFLRRDGDLAYLLKVMRNTWIGSKRTTPGLTVPAVADQTRSGWQPRPRPDRRPACRGVARPYISSAQCSSALGNSPSSLSAPRPAKPIPSSPPKIATASIDLRPCLSQ